MTKLSKLIAGLLFIVLLATSVQTVFASRNVPPTCNPQVFEIDADEDNDAHYSFGETGGKLEITFNDTDGAAPSEDDRDQVVITVASGYEIVNVQYELEHYSGIGWTTVPGVNPTTTITLSGVDDDSRIDEVEVKVQEICPTSPQTPPTTTTGGSKPDEAKAPQCSDPNTVKTPANFHVQRNGEKATVNFFITEGDTGDVFYKEKTASDWQHSIIGLKPNADKFVSTEINGLNTNLDYTFGARQRIGCGGGDIITTEPSESSSQGEVLGASTMAGTGTFQETMMNLYMIFGMILVLAGYLSYAKEKKII